MHRWLEEYLKHFALNFGQALQGIRYIYSHPDVDLISSRGSLRHIALSFRIRLQRIANDLFFAIIPPHWHHTPEELSGMCRVSLARWFQYGYGAWRFTERGEIKTDLSIVDRRWGPRCQNLA
jgi:hypothetical protein